VLGALLFVAHARLAGPARATGRAPVVITAARVAEIRDEYARTLGTPPTATELDALVAKEAEEEMLFREALLLGLDRGDRTVEWRVVEKMRFLYGDQAGTHEEAFKRGLELGLDREDIVVRNTLTTKMRLLARAASQSEEPTGAVLDRELEEYLRQHPETYAQGDRVSLVQVFLDGGKRGAAVAAEAEALRGRLEASGESPETAPRQGDPFAVGNVFRNAARRDLAKIFGEDFATTVEALPTGQWSEPIRTPYGMHLVWISGRAGGSLPALADVRSRVLNAYRAERRERYLARMVEAVRGAYEVRVEVAAAQQ
jgi:hypothetical protein